MSETLLLEIGLEEIPARFVRSSGEQLKEKMGKFLAEHRLEHGVINVFATPRRLAVTVENVAEKQEDLVEKAKGPAKKIALDAEGNWSKAAMGFARGQGVGVEDLYFEDLKGVEYAYANKESTGVSATEVFTKLPLVIQSLHFPVTMRWANETFEYIRPIHWIVALLGDEVVPFSLLDVEAGRVTRGHRFLGEEISLATADEYEERLKEQFVIANLETRTRMIKEQIKVIEQENNWLVPLDATLLEEVVSLVEYPTAFYGHYDEKYLTVPEEVLVTSMKEHQRYFEVTDHNGDLLPYFIAVRNGNSNHLDSVRKGNQKVLTARLEDALFFYEEDKKTSIEKFVNKLASVSFHAKIGSLADKMNQTAQLAATLADLVNLSQEECQQVARAAQIYKFDLVSNMVGEFPELQGKMGERYALLQGESPEVAAAIREHYLPLSSDSDLPETKIGAVLAVADKLDSIISFFIQDMIPTGSNDPYALRRQMIGVVQIIDSNQWYFSLQEFFMNALSKVYQISDAGQAEKLTHDLMEFAKGRVQQRLQTQAISHDVQEAVLNSMENNLALVIQNAQILHEHQGDEHYKEAIEALARVVNIAAKAEKPFEVDMTLLETLSEKTLYQQTNHLESIWATANAAEKYQALEDLEPHITAFFNENMVMVDDSAVRHTRLSTLGMLAEKIITFADVRKLITK